MIEQVEAATKDGLLVEQDVGDYKGVASNARVFSIARAHDNVVLAVWTGDYNFASVLVKNDKNKWVPISFNPALTEHYRLSERKANGLCWRKDIDDTIFAAWFITNLETIRSIGR